MADRPTIGAELHYQRQIDFEADLAMARDPYTKPYKPTEAAMDSQPS